jgi:hypothetical protein
VKKDEAKSEFWKMMRDKNLQYMGIIDVLLDSMTIKQIEKATKLGEMKK